MTPGEQWAYRLRDSAPSERVMLRELRPRKRSPRAEIEFLDGENAGEIVEVPAARLRVPWTDVAAYDQLMANWDRIGEYELTSAESSAVEQVFNHLIPEHVAEWSWNPARWACALHDSTALGILTRRDTADLLEGVATFQHEGTLWTSAEGTKRIAAAVAHANPIPVLARVHENERECRERTKRGHRSATRGEGTRTSPEWEYEFYLEHYRPLHELLREWCGHRAVTFYERSIAAEHEVQRLDELLARAIDALRDKDGAILADYLERDHEHDRITPYNVRPSIERPLRPSEIPVRVVYRRGWW